MIPGFLKAALEKKLSANFNFPVVIADHKPLSGGCINSCFRLQTSAGNLFLKYNYSGRYPHMFEDEANGLQVLAGANAFSIPGVIATGEADDISYLILEWIEPAKRIGNFWQEFGRSLAKLHRSTAGEFGLGFNNYIGSLVQSNRSHKRWVDFFIQERLEPQIRLGLDSGIVGHADVVLFNKLFSRLDDIFPVENPALLHGDLWSGNFLTDKTGNATLIDPAVYYGHREMDLGMTKLFGGFDAEFYAAYSEMFPLEAGFEKRVDIYNLYPLLVHVNLLGGDYIHQVQKILERYS